MANSLRNRGPSARVFLLSGIDAELRKELGRKIQLLGGKYFDIEGFKALCTHVVCGKLSRSEKYLGACATGKWVLHPEYILQSADQMIWLDEEQFEWSCSEIGSNEMYEMKIAPRRWRFLLGGQGGAFTGWKVSVVAGPQKSQVYKRLLISGGADVYNLKIPVKDPNKIANTLTYIFVTEHNIASVVHLFEYGVLCLRPDFIGDYLIKDPPPDPMDYLIFAASDLPLSQSQEKDLDLTSSQASSQADSISSTPVTLDFTALEFPGTPGANTPVRDASVRSKSPTPEVGVPTRPSTSSSQSPVKSAPMRTKRQTPEPSVTHPDRPTSSPGPAKSEPMRTRSQKFVGAALNSTLKSESSVKVGSVQTGSQTLDVVKHKSLDEPESNSPVQTLQMRTRGQKNQVSSGSLSAPVKESGVRTRRKTVGALATPTVTASGTPDEGRRVTRRSAIGVPLSTADVAGFGRDTPVRPHSPVVGTLSVLSAPRCRTPVRETRARSRSPALNTLLHAPVMTRSRSSSPALNTLLQAPVMSSTPAKDLPEETRSSADSLLLNNDAPKTRTISNDGPETKSSVPAPPSPGRVISGTAGKDTTLRTSSATADVLLNASVAKPDTSIEDLPKTARSPVFMEVSTFYTGVKDSPIRARFPLISANSLNIESNSNMSDKCTPKRTNSPGLSTQSGSGTPESSKPTKDAKVKPLPAAVRALLSSGAPMSSTPGTLRRHKGSGTSPQKSGTYVKDLSSPVRTGNSVIANSSIPKNINKLSSRTLTQESIHVKGQSSPVRTRKSVTGTLSNAATSFSDSNLPATTSVTSKAPETGTPVIPGSSTKMPVNISVSSSRKRKMRQDSVHLALQEVKRQRLSLHDWRPTMFATTIWTNETTGNRAMELPQAGTEIIHAALDEGFVLVALDGTMSHISPRYYPQGKTLHALMTQVLQCAKTDLQSTKAYQVLMNTLKLHPPVSPALQEVYLESLRSHVKNPGPEGDAEILGEEWNFVRDCVKCVLNETGDTLSRGQKNNWLLLKYLFTVVEINFKQHIDSYGDSHQVGSRRGKSILVRMLWGPTYQVFLNNKCRELLELLSEVLICQLQMELKMELIQVLVGLVSMVTESCYVSETSTLYKGITETLPQKTAIFIHEIATRINGADLKCELLKAALNYFHTPWLTMHVCRHLLDMLDDYLLPDDLVKDQNLSLSFIVSHYFFLLPHLVKSTDPAVRTEHLLSPADTQRNSLKSRQPEQVQAELREIPRDVNNLNIEKMAGKANKRNFKGETPLHVACIKNDVQKVKQLLQVPGIDVNVRDNADWTPLHEACNHGSIQCVKELLKFAPARTVEHFFSKDTVKCRKVDLTASNSDGITPLHDAVLNNKIEVCRLLLQHGGNKLLKLVTKANFTPIDLAETEEMKVLLMSALPSPPKNVERMDYSSSQDSVASVDETRTDMPADQLYDHVLAIDGLQLHARLENIISYIQLVTHLVTSYIKVSSVHMIRDTVNETLPSTGQFTFARRLSSRINELSGMGKENIPVNNTDMPGSSSSSDHHISFVPSEEVRCLVRDLELVSHLPKHMNLFRSHLYRITHQMDHAEIDRELIWLSVLVEGVLNGGST